MPIVPKSDIDALNFYEIHGTIWNSNAVALNIPTALATAIKGDATAARTAYTAQQNAQAAAKAATLVWQSAMQTLRTAGSNGIAAIKATADNAANPDTVYALAQIPAPSQGNPLPPPGTPDTFTCSILATGALTLKWKMPSAQPGNTFYQVKRKLLGETAYTIIGGSGNKTFTDDTLPAGTDSVQYIVTAIRGSSAGPDSLPVNVQFGVSGDGFTATGANTVKLAA